MNFTRLMPQRREVGIMVSRDHNTETLIINPGKHITRKNKKLQRNITYACGCKNSRKPNSRRCKNWDISQECKAGLTHKKIYAINYINRT